MKIKKDIKQGNRIAPKGKVAPAGQPSIYAGQDTPFETFIKKNSLLVFSGAALLLICIVFHKFLLFDYTYVFKDQGSDTVNQFWVRMVRLSVYMPVLFITLAILLFLLFYPFYNSTHPLVISDHGTGRNAAIISNPVNSTIRTAVAFFLVRYRRKCF